MTGSPNSASPPRPWPSIAAAILACCLAGYGVTVSLLHRSGTLSTRAVAADAAAVAAALAVIALLWLAWRASARTRDGMSPLEQQASQQEARLTGQAEQLADQ